MTSKVNKVFRARSRGNRFYDPARKTLAAAVLIFEFACGGATADTYPDHAIKMVVPFPAGGATDTAARLVARGMSTVLGQTVVIENQGGAGGTIGTRQVVGAAPDGYTLLATGATNTFATAPLLYKLDYDPVKALVPVGLTTVDPGALVVTASLPVNTIHDLVRLAKESPGKLNYGSSIGIGPHFIAELFKINAGVNIVHVPYRGGAPMITDLVAGQVQMTVNGKSVLMPHIQSGKLKALAVTGPARWRELPDVPTLVEADYLKEPYDSLFGIVAPGGTPHEIIAKLNAAINQGLKSPEVVEGLAKIGIEPNPGTVQDFTDLIAREIPRWTEIVRVTGITVAR